MIDQVHFHEAGALVIPVGIGANRDLLFHQRAGFGQAAAMTQALRIAYAQAVHRGRTHPFQVLVDFRADFQKAIGA